MKLTSTPDFRRYSYSIPIFNFPVSEEDDDEETIVENLELRVSHGSPRLSGRFSRFRRDVIADLRRWFASISFPATAPFRSCWI